MSEHPLTPQNTKIIVCGVDANQIADAVAKYGTDVATVTVVSVVTVADAAAARAAHSALTPWCILAHANEFAIGGLQRFFGSPRTLSDCLRMTPNDYAINPRLLRS